jgi:hypothetical protein
MIEPVECTTEGLLDNAGSISMTNALGAYLAIRCDPILENRACQETTRQLLA